MDPDVITFEASRSGLDILNAIGKSGFAPQVGPGVYDIHSPRVPAVNEIELALQKMIENGKIEKEKLWVNPDCGLKTRGEAETVRSLENLVSAAKNLRAKFLRA
jgi:5-methyltetrahydropteroyltriglutamate--homocysteine methyltransferase